MLAGLRLLSALVLAVALSSQADALFVRRDAAPITLPFARRVNATGAAKLLKIDQARAKALKSRAKTGTPSSRLSAISNVPASNQAVDYTTTVTVGSQQFELLIDTGSSNTWVGSRGGFAGTDNTQDTGNLVEVVYGSGFVLGEQVIDDITLGDGLTIKDQSFGVALLSQGFDDVDGIIGIGPVDLTADTLIGPDEDATVPTVTDNAFSQGLIDAHEIGISFQPTTSVGNLNGELTFGGTDPSKFTGPLTFVPITSTSPANEFVGIDQTITYGSADGTTVLPATSGITDTGTTLTLLATDAFTVYQNLTGAVPDDNTGLLRLTPDQFANLQSLFFTIGDNTFEFTPNAQIWPRALNTLIGGTPDFVYLIVNDLGSLSGEGLDFIDGMTFLERFYYVFDIANSQVGFATTPFTDALTN
ncbi:acid protease [Polyporus arcularius HHB13444]|uniref:Acid protease n=1 Tax=Polyporus arcularius HHB13444 TaxID=1314778 RepID=A0A5C3PJB5_9APHY|nr:acid protease [Polyporus arcularius HHB13444]